MPSQTVSQVRRARRPERGEHEASPAREVALHHRRPRFVRAVVATTTALLVVATSWTAGIAAPRPAAAARPLTTAERVVPDHRDVTASRSEFRQADDDNGTPGLTRSDAAWGQRLTAAAEAWFKAHPPAPAPVAPVAPDTPDVVPPTPSPTPDPTPPPAAPPAATPANPPQAPAPRAPSAPSGPSRADYRAAAEAFLTTLPGGDTAKIEWGDPDGHLGGVWIPGSETIILNAARLDGKLEQTKDVLRHEIGHVHQNRAMAASGMSLADYEARINAIFGDQGIEKSADAVALLLGAHTVRYSSSFTAAQYDAARAILADQVP